MDNREELKSTISNKYPSYDSLLEQHVNLELNHQELLERFDEVQEQLSVLIEQLKVMNQRQFGRKTEVMDIKEAEEDRAFNEAEANADLSDDGDKPKGGRRKPGFRQASIENIDRTRDLHYTCSKEELDARFGENNWKEVKDEVEQKVFYHRAWFEVLNIHTHVYASKKNTGEMLRASRPVDLIPNSLATPSLVAEIIVSKFAKGVPLYRQEQAFAETGFQINRTTMANWCISASRYFEPLWEKMKQVMMQEHILHADETPFLVTKDGREAGSKSYMWVYATRQDTQDVPPIILYEYQPTRKAEHPEKFLQGYEGVLVCDGYAAYHKIADKPENTFTVAGCWAHAKRKFATVVKALGGPKKARGKVVCSGDQMISEIYHEDNKLEGLSFEEKLKGRQEKVKPLVDKFFQWAKQTTTYVNPKGETGKAITYALNQEKYLRAFLDDPNIPLDNSRAERSIRPFTVGRKAWIMIDTPKGAHSSALEYSIVETAKANDLKVYDYIEYLLEELPQYAGDIPDHLLPWSPQLPENIRKKKRK